MWSTDMISLETMSLDQYGQVINSSIWILLPCNAPSNWICIDPMQTWIYEWHVQICDQLVQWRNEEFTTSSTTEHAQSDSSCSSILYATIPKSLAPHMIFYPKI